MLQVAQPRSCHAVGVWLGIMRVEEGCGMKRIAWSGVRNRRMACQGTRTQPVAGSENGSRLDFRASGCFGSLGTPSRISMAERHRQTKPWAEGWALHLGTEYRGTHLGTERRGTQDRNGSAEVQRLGTESRGTQAQHGVTGTRYRHAVKRRSRLRAPNGVKDRFGYPLAAESGPGLPGEVPFANCTGFAIA
jgi:hypothetical protein